MKDGLKRFLDKNSQVPTIGSAAVAAVATGNYDPLFVGGGTAPEPEQDSRVRTAAITMDTKLTSLTDRFFKFYKKNRDKPEAYNAYITTINSDFEKWLKKNATIYDFEKCKHLFLSRMEDCLDTGMLHIQFNKKPEEKISPDNLHI